MLKACRLWMTCLLLTSSLYAASTQLILQAGNDALLPMPLSWDMGGVTRPDPGQNPALFRMEGERKIALPCQIESGRHPRLWFQLDRSLRPQEKVTLRLENTEQSPSNRFTTTVDAQAILLQCQGRDILRYYSALHEVPEGVDPIFRRSGFIHPLWSPSGRVLTRIQPPDHYHHYGIWNPWTKTHVQGRQVDFWNLNAKQGTIRFAGILSTVAGPVYSGFKVRQEHVDFNLSGEDQTAIREVWDVRTSACTLEKRTVWVIDFTTTLNNALDTPIRLDQYRYGGGLGFRATKAWINANSQVLTSAGKTRVDADGTRARWCDIRGAIDGDDAGILFCSHTGNREHPEPMRVWPKDMIEGRGEVFFEFCPIRLNEWTLQPQKDYVLRYRMLVYDGALHPETAEVAWRQFVTSPHIEVTP